MKTAHELGAETQTPLPPIVREQLLDVSWGTEDYPTDLLLLSENEQHILEEVSTGLPMREIAKREGLPHSVATARYYTAVGKQEATSAFESDVLALSPLAQRVVVLNKLFGATWNRGNTVVINTEPEVVLKNAQELDELMGEKWKRCPQLSVIPVDTLRERIERYDRVLSPNWRNSPVLLTQSPDVVEQRAALYDQWFGEGWQMKPSILTNDPDTVISSARAMKTVGITQENTPPGPYFGLLGTTVGNKRKKAAFIRSSILGHQQIYIHETKKPISEIVRARQGQTPAEKELEAQEIEEFKIFVRHLGAKGLTFSTSSIRSWATAHGYPALPRSKVQS